MNGMTNAFFVASSVSMFFFCCAILLARLESRSAISMVLLLYAP